MSAEGPAFVFRLNDNGLGPDLVRHVFLERGWLEFDEDLHGDNDWNFWWKTSRFRNCDYDTLQAHQRLNHYPRSTAITKKDSLARNMKRMRGVYGPGVYNFSPIAFNLPNDYTRFVAEYSRLKEKGDKPFWICKPADLSRGRGIFVFQDLSELQYDCNAVVQRYISNPLLIAGYKFDLRIYVAVPSFHPLKAYVYREGLVRFGTEKFDLTALDNLYAHLTNTSINKHSPSYNIDKERVGPGCKWTLSQLRHYFHQANIDDSLMWTRIIQIVVLTLLIQAHQAPKATNCYELYGFDIIIDEQMKPWLLEVNFSPALSSDCPNDSIVKKPMLHDLIDLLGFKESDKIPGYYESYMPSSQTSCELLTRSPQSKPCGHLGLLPHISSQSMQSLTTSIAQEAGQDGDEGLVEEAEEEQAVVPVIPGCGLPSVQTSHRYTASRRSSASSARSYGSYESCERSHKSLQCSQLLNAKAYNMQGYLRHKSLNKMSQSLTRPALQPPNTLQSKLSVQSDSGVSMMSGSSDNSDPSSCTEDLTVGDGCVPIIKPKKALSDTHHNLYSNIKAMAPLKGAIKPANGTTQEGTKNGPTLSTNAPTMSHYRSNATSRELRRSAQPSFTGNPLVGKSVMLGRRSSIPNVSPRTGTGQSHRLSYARPWRANDSGSVATKPSVSHREPQFLPKAGDFMLVFPFNATLRKCAQGNLDDRIVIRECQRLVKQATPPKNGSKVSLDSADSNPVADIPLPWGQFTKTEEIYNTH